MKTPYTKSYSKGYPLFSSLRIPKRFGLAFAYLVLVGAAVNLAAADGAPKGEIESQRNLDAVLNFLRPAFTFEGGPARISYATVCIRDGAFLPFPKLQVRPPSTGETGFNAVREIFRDDKRVKVTQNRSGIVTITVGEPLTDILETRILRLALPPKEQYNAQLKPVSPVDTEEFRSAERALGIKVPPSVLGYNVVEPTKGLPHLPSSLRNITVDEALDRIARTFHVAILYSSCPAQSNQPRMIMFDSVPLYDALRPPWFPRH